MKRIIRCLIIATILAALVVVVAGTANACTTKTTYCKNTCKEVYKPVCKDNALDGDRYCCKKELTDDSTTDGFVKKNCCKGDDVVVKKIDGCKTDGVAKIDGCKTDGVAKIDGCKTDGVAKIDSCKTYCQKERSYGCCRAPEW